MPTFAIETEKCRRKHMQEVCAFTITNEEMPTYKDSTNSFHNHPLSDAGY